MRSVKTLKNCKGKYVLVRADFNVPLIGTRVADDLRIRAAYPTIDLLRKAGARVILLSHIGRDPQDTLRPVANILKKTYGTAFLCMPELLGERVEKFRAGMKNGDVMLLGNLRSMEGEKAGDKVFAKQLAALGDFYVNEAFPVSHREDASIVQLPKLLPAYAGLQLEKEVKHLSLALKPKHPFLFIQGGAKAETKIPLLRRYLKAADHVFIGGKLANDFFQAEGIPIGKSQVDENVPSLIPFTKSIKLIIPGTVVVERGGKKTTTSVHDVHPNESILDIGLPSIDALGGLIKKAKLIVWNGPMGWYEGGYTKGTEEMLKLLAGSKATTIVAGGDTAVLVAKKKLSDKFTFVSTGGGATLDFLAKGTLPGIKALK